MTQMPAPVLQGSNVVNTVAKATTAGISTNVATPSAKDYDISLGARAAWRGRRLLPPSSAMRSSVSSPSMPSSRVMERAVDGVTNAACNAMASGLGAVGMAASTAISLLRGGKLEWWRVMIGLTGRFENTKAQPCRVLVTQTLRFSPDEC